MSPAARARCLAGGLCALVLVADQATKRVVEDQLTVGEKVHVLGPLDLTLTHNTGIAFGLAGGAGAGLVVLSLVALGAVVYVFARNPTRPAMWVAAGLLGGGALGNLADRVRADRVTDFVALPHWPAFNLADAAITLGVVVLIAVYLREGAREAAHG
jgi:signal peptidase II